MATTVYQTGRSSNFVIEVGLDNLDSCSDGSQSFGFVALMMLSSRCQVFAAAGRDGERCLMRTMTNYTTRDIPWPISHMTPALEFDIDKIEVH